MIQYKQVILKTFVQWSWKHYCTHTKYSINIVQWLHPCGCYIARSRQQWLAAFVSEKSLFSSKILTFGTEMKSNHCNNKVCMYTRVRFITQTLTFANYQNHTALWYAVLLLVLLISIKCHLHSTSKWDCFEVRFVQMWPSFWDILKPLLWVERTFYEVHWSRG